MYGLSYQLVDGWEGFRAGVRQSLTSPGVGLIEVRDIVRVRETDRYRRIEGGLLRDCGRYRKQDHDGSNQ